MPLSLSLSSVLHLHDHFTVCQFDSHILEIDFYLLPSYSETAVLRCTCASFLSFWGLNTAVLSWRWGGQLRGRSELRELYLCGFPTCSYFTHTHTLFFRDPRCPWFLSPSGVLELILLYFSFFLVVKSTTTCSAV